MVTKVDHKDMQMHGHAASPAGWVEAAASLVSWVEAACTGGAGWAGWAVLAETPGTGEGSEQVRQW